MSQPWETGDQSERWAGYLLDDQMTLRNLVGARDPMTLRDREDRRVEARALTLREHGIPATYDLDGLRAIHGHLFQDVYEWAGQVRTVAMAKEDRGFMPPEHIEAAMGQVAGILAETDNLRTIPESAYPDTLARMYHVVNWTHPFREGNGRTQRELFTALARESGHEIDWNAVKGFINDRVSVAAIDGDLEPMVGMFQTITTQTPTGHAQAVSAALTSGQGSSRESGNVAPMYDRPAAYGARPEQGYER